MEQYDRAKYTVFVFSAPSSTTSLQMSSTCCSCVYSFRDQSSVSQIVPVTTEQLWETLEARSELALVERLGFTSSRPAFRDGREYSFACRQIHNKCKNMSVEKCERETSTSDFYKKKYSHFPPDCVMIWLILLKHFIQVHFGCEIWSSFRSSV